MDYQWKGVKLGAAAPRRSAPLTIERVKKIIDLITPIQDTIWSTLQDVTYPESHEALERIKENLIVFYEPKRSGEFSTHLELRLAVDGRKIRMICPKDPNGQISEIYFYLKSHWNDVFAAGSQKKVRLGCRVTLVDGKATVTADGKESYPAGEFRKEREFYERLKDIEGIVQIHRMVVVHSWKRSRSHQLYLMKYYPEGTLEDEVIENRLSERQKFIIVFRLMEILTQVHTKNVSHNDLKLQNILLDEHLMPYLTDFGLSTNADTMLTRVIGSAGIFPSEMCPSVISRRFRLIDRKVEKLNREREKAVDRYHQLLDQMRLDSDSKDLKDQHDDVAKKIKEFDRNIPHLDLEHQHTFQNILRFCAMSYDHGQRIVPKQNDICALGFIIEDLFGREFHPDLTSLIDEMSSPVISMRIGLEEARVKLQNIQRIISVSRSARQVS